MSYYVVKNLVATGTPLVQSNSVLALNLNLFLNSAVGVDDPNDLTMSYQ